MENNTNAATLNAPVVLTEKVKALKLIARNALRMELISPRLATISHLEKDIKANQEDGKAMQKRIDIAYYKITRLTRLDSEHPDLENLKKNQENNIDEDKKVIESINKETETLNKLIVNEKEAIAKIEAGETLINAEDLADMVNKLILQDAKTTIIPKGNSINS